MRLPELLASALVGTAALALAPVTAWALLALPPALVVGIAAARGADIRTVWSAVERTDNGDAGAGPAGLAP